MKKAANAAKKNEWFSKTFAIGQLRSVSLLTELLTLQKYFRVA
jgi:hypothetical protein